MLSNHEIEDLIDKNLIVVSAEELEEFENETVLSPDYVDGSAHSDASAASLIEDLEFNGFTEDEIKQLFDGSYLHDGGPWGIIPHIARLYSDPDNSYYILTVEVAG